MKSRLFAVAILVSIVPLSALAQDVTLGSIANTFTTVVVQAIMGLLVATATAFFFYGIFRYVMGIRDGDQNRITQGNQFIIWGMVSLFVMVSAWGIVVYAQRLLNIDTKTTIVIPNSGLK
jgi:hypothetical protein